MKNKKIGSRINGFVVVVFIAAIAVILGITLLQFNEYSNTQNNEQAVKGMESLNRTIDGYKAHSKELAMAIAADSNVAVMIEENDAEGLATELSWLSQDSETDFIAVTDASGIVLAGNSDYLKAGDDISAQENIREALAGNTAALIEQGDVVQLAVRSAAPVLNEAGMPVGVVTAGYALDNTEFVDKAKEIYKTDFTLFKGDLRVNTTLMKDGKRAIGTTLDPKIASIVLEQGKYYEGSGLVLGQEYVYSYMPLKNTKGEVIGAFFSGQPAAQAKAESNRILIWALIIAAAAIAALVILSSLYIRKIMTRPLDKLVLRAKRIAAGDIGGGEEADVKRSDEIGVLFDAFSSVISSFRKLAADANMLADAAVEGKLATRADASLHEGDYRKIIEGVNNTLDAMMQPVNIAAECLETIANGEEYGLIPLDAYNGDFKLIMGNLNLLMKSLFYLREDAFKLSEEAINGNLSARADTLKHQGGFRKIIEGINHTMDAIINPITEAKTVLNEMAKGNLQVNMTGEYKGDHAIIKEALNNTIGSINAYISEIAETLEKCAQGDLSVEITSEFKGDFVKLKHSINKIIQSLNEVLLEINTVAEQVTQGAQQVSNGNQAISQGAAQQAGSIEELSASALRIAEQTKENAENAKLSNKLAKETKTAAAQGNDQMREMLQSMQNINHSSENISKIIKVIDDIAFQTNILALNAAVEAARAGSHGKGFAVVAEEVRNLAARSAKAASETAELIEGSTKNVAQGTEIANDTAKALSTIVESVDKTVELGKKIALASDEQLAGIKQVNEQIDQMSQVVQTNSATSQEGAAASEELSGQAEMLKEKIGMFVLKKSDIIMHAGSSSSRLKKPEGSFAQWSELSLSDDMNKY